MMRGMTPVLPHALAHVALEQGGVITAAQCSGAGMSRDDRREAVRVGVLHELRRDVFTPGEYWRASDERERHRIEIAGALVARRWRPGDSGPPLLAAGGTSAGFLHTLPLPNNPRTDNSVFAEAEELLPWNRRPHHIHLVSANRDRRTYRAGVEVRPAALPPEHVVTQGVVPVCSLARTAVDLMRDSTRVEAVFVADAAMHFGTSRAELQDVLDSCRQWPKTLTARQAIAFADCRAESPAESLARVVCSDDGIETELQVDLYDAFGHIGRVDLLLRAFRVVIEVDGAVKYLDPWCGDVRQAIEEQEAREKRLRDAGWIVVRTTWHELINNPEGFLSRLRVAMALGLRSA